ncbi:MAG: 4-hydroxythreonine-4-phosphate dehydrogenase PdxA [Bacteroidetes bacterium]|nr:4-hydroxythreonine-4-phosphate dehydrogenase PdxA [Bacteroidota bacterium]
MKAGITIGDINGIGIEVILKTFSDRRIFDFCTPVVYGSSKVISYHRKALKLNEFNFNTIRDINGASAQKFNVINCWQEDVIIDLGKATETSGLYSLKSIDAALVDLKAGKIDYLVTAPVNKHKVPVENFRGHTEYLATAFGTDSWLMMMTSENLRIGLVTEHVPLSQVPATLTVELIVKKIKVFNNSLVKDFGIRKPKIAVLGLNPHAGENGTIGTEESEKIIPAINRAKDDGRHIFGPYSGDGFFGASLHLKFDGILAMYHDQGLIPFKLLAFENGVNYTAGLPVIRTSPDHGTAFDIAGAGVASESSFRQALLTGAAIVKNRKFHGDITANPLKTATLEKEMQQ